MHKVIHARHCYDVVVAVEMAVVAAVAGAPCGNYAWGDSACRCYQLGEGGVGSNAWGGSRQCPTEKREEVVYTSNIFLRALRLVGVQYRPKVPTRWCIWFLR